MTLLCKHRKINVIIIVSLLPLLAYIYGHAHSEHQTVCVQDSQVPRMWGIVDEIVRDVCAKRSRVHYHSLCMMAYHRIGLSGACAYWDSNKITCAT